MRLPQRADYFWRELLLQHLASKRCRVCWGASSSGQVRNTEPAALWGQQNDANTEMRYTHRRTLSIRHH